MKIRASRSRRIRTTIIWIISVGVVVLIAGLGYQYVTRDTSAVPPHIRRELTFSPLVVPLRAGDYQTSHYKFSRAEDNVQILTYVINTPQAAKVTVSEYVQPTEFSEIPDYKDRFLTNVAQQQSTVQTANGTIYLGQLPKQNNKQIGIMLEKGLIVFLSPSKTLSTPEWRALGEVFEIQKSS